MRKSWITLLVMIISLFLINLVCAVRINEVELNPEGTDTGDEWIELYSDNEVNLTGWKIINNDDNEIELNQVFNGYLIIELDRQWLDNSDEKIFLYNDDTLIDETDLIEDSENDDKTWQYCNEQWNLTIETKNSENDCEDDSNNEENNNLENNDPEISISIDWDEDDIINGEEFDIQVIVENLDENKNYDVKVWIENKDDEKISQTYDENDEWVSSNQYFDDFFEQEINEEKDITLRIHENHDDYFNDAKIYLRIREEDKSDYIKEIDENIEILEPEEDDEPELESEEDDDAEKVGTNLPQTTGQVIKLGISTPEIIESGTESLKEQNNMIYQSKSEYIKKYAIFGFALLCVGLSIFLVFKKL